MTSKEAMKIVSSLHPRVVKLARRGKPFIVIGCHEPYFQAAYDLIEGQERRQGTWTSADSHHKHASLQVAKREQPQ